MSDKPETILDFDFGFTAVNADELEVVREAKAVAETTSVAAQSNAAKAQLIYDAVMPLLNNLKANPEKIGGLKVTGLNSRDGFKFILEDGDWLLIRFSGTEPVMRVYCETTREDCVQPILQDGLRIAGLA